MIVSVRSVKWNFENDRHMLEIIKETIVYF